MRPGGGGGGGGAMSAAEDGSADVSVEAFSISAPKVGIFFKIRLRFFFPGLPRVLCPRALGRFLRRSTRATGNDRKGCVAFEVAHSRPRLVAEAACSQKTNYPSRPASPSQARCVKPESLHQPLLLKTKSPPGSMFMSRTFFSPGPYVPAYE